MPSLRYCHNVFFLFVIAVLVVTMTGCGSSSHPVAVTITQGASVSLDNGQTKNLAVTVANDSQSAGVSWSLSGVGTLSGTTIGAATYNAPASGAVATATVNRDLRRRHDQVCGHYDPHRSRTDDCRYSGATRRHQRRGLYLHRAGERGNGAAVLVRFCGCTSHRIDTESERDHLRDAQRRRHTESVQLHRSGARRCRCCRYL